MSYQPAEKLTNRTFVGLIIAQFLAGFNDQAIHAAAMFYAIHSLQILSQANAITLMPILFYSPWAIFCSYAGFYADRYSKTLTLRFWKISEIAISLLLIAGFYFGTNEAMPRLGGWIVMACVFLMGTHAAFFAPAKYGAMPEILRPHILSRGNGILESTTFLASILGTVGGGLLFGIFRGQEVWIGVIVLALSAIGAAASFLIVWLPASSPERSFPINPIAPVIDNLKIMLRSRPLALSMLGIAFFVFMVSYMRASMYMHGETRNPRWDEEKTSFIVATVALGVGLGSPLAGYLSGGKVELGLVPLGCLGMIFALFVSALAMEETAILVVALVIIGFFSGFYMVPLYTLLQQRAPKKSKGELVATSNFINVTGAIAASLLFNVLVQASRLTGMTPEIVPEDPAIIKGQEAVGKLQEVQRDLHGKIRDVFIEQKNGDILEFKAKSLVNGSDQAEQEFSDTLGDLIGERPIEYRVIDFDDNFFDVLSGTPQKGDPVIVSRYKLRDVRHYLIRNADQPLRKIYDNEILPRYLFLGAALMTLGILFLLRRLLPDFYVRSLFWFKALGKFRIKAVGMQNLPTAGPVILATNCKDLTSSLQMVVATDRATKVVLVDDGAALRDGALLRWLALRYSIVAIRPDQAGTQAWPNAKLEAEQSLRNGNLLAVCVENDTQGEAVEALLQELRRQTGAPILPVYCGTLDDESMSGGTSRVRVVFGEMLAEPASVEACKKAIRELGAWIRENDDAAVDEHH